jgi:hypothetical protein
VSTRVPPPQTPQIPAQVPSKTSFLLLLPSRQSRAYMLTIGQCAPSNLQLVEMHPKNYGWSKRTFQPSRLQLVAVHSNYINVPSTLNITFAAEVPESNQVDACVCSPFFACMFATLYRRSSRLKSQSTAPTCCTGHHKSRPYNRTQRYRRCAKKTPKINLHKRTNEQTNKRTNYMAPSFTASHTILHDFWER